ncbi:fatty acid desaturase family protein [Nocardia sp. NPDC046473]|uniref:fatty acid desaturase family protein n=1 Tax=Nocardia sp. NPDC046473 TaxID=3155733 RepID=UPI0033ED5EBA
MAALQHSGRSDNWRNAFYIGLDWGIIALAIAIPEYFNSWSLWLLAVVIIGSRMRALANLMHEAAHRKLFRSRSINDAVGAALCAWPILVDYQTYLTRHRRHHARLWSERDDPDFDFFRRTGAEYQTSDQMSFRRFALIHIAYGLFTVWSPVRLWHGLGRGSGLAIRLLGAAAVAAAVTLATRQLPIPLIAFWAVPWITTFQSFTYWAELGEHAGLRARGRKWGSRNWFGGRLTRTLIGPHSDDSYHLLHHWFPTVPHYRLKSLHRVCLRQWSRYREHQRCGGFFLSTARGRSVLYDVWAGGAIDSEADNIRM